MYNKIKFSDLQGVGLMKSKLFLIAVSLLLAVNANAANLVGLWEFDDAADLGEATIGTDLTWTGSPAAAAGVESGDGAAFSPIGTYLTADNPIGANGGGIRTNEYTMLIDFKLPTINAWNPVLETTNPGGISTDGDYWISTSRGLGVASEGYVNDTDPPTSVSADTWHRLVIYVDQGTLRRTYVDGVYLGDHNAGAVDGRWTMSSTFSLFGDNTASERSDFYVSTVALFDGLLTDSEVIALGTAGDSVYPKIAYNPTPKDDATFVLLDTNLSWSAPTYESGTATYAIYFGTTEPNELLTNYGLAQLDNSADTSATTIDPEPTGGLLTSTTYYWVVDSYEPNSPNPIFHPGTAWSFTTVPADPIPDQQPQDTAVFPTETAVFTATADSDTPLSYQWKKVASGGDVDVPGATSSTLTLTDVALSDEGYYYCQFTNDTEVPINSDSALLTVKRQLVHLPLDGDTLAGPGTAIDGVGNGELEWGTAGISGTAVTLTQDNTNPDILDYIKLVDDANDLLFADRTDFTVSVWVLCDYVSGEGSDTAIISNKNWNSGGNQGWVIHNGYGNGRAGWNWKAADGPRRDYGLPDEPGNYINGGQWHHLLVSHDRDGNADFYLDGLLKNQTEIAGDGDIDAGFPTVIGTDGDEGVTWHYGFVGTIDEVEIWNYTMDKGAVATLYESYSGISPCVYPPALDTTGPSGEPDCRVNLYDFAEFAAAWLNSEVVQP